MTYRRCSLPMYDLPEVSARNDVIFKYVSKEICSILEAVSGQNDLRESMGLTEDGFSILKDAFLDNGNALYRNGQDTSDAENVWKSKQLLFSQICGQPLTTDSEVSHLKVVGRPIYNASGCVKGGYKSFIIAKKGQAHLYSESLHNLAGKKVAVNHDNSFSGAVALKNFVYRLESEQRAVKEGEFRIFFDPKTVFTGSHRESVRAVATLPGVDIAAIDCITFAILEKYAPAELENVTVVAETSSDASAPAAPIVVQKKMMHNGVARVIYQAFDSVLNLRSKILKSLQDLTELKEALDGLFIQGFERSELIFYQSSFVNLNAHGDFIDFKVWSPSSEDSESSQGGDSPPGLAYFERLDSSQFVFPVTAASHEAQLWFNRGMLLAYNFNHEEAKRCFEETLRYDPRCYMAHWGIAYVSGIYYNGQICSVPDMRLACKHSSAANALLASKSGTAPSDLEKRLISAIACRAIENYADVYDETDQGEAAKVLHASNVTYAAAMRAVHQEYSADPDVSALFAEALMNLTPWDLWPRVLGKSRVKSLGEGLLSATTFEIKQVLELAIENNSPHPGLAHFYVHLMEMAPVRSMVRSAVPQTHLLRSQWPACGHLLHMASHIDIQLGSYDEAIRTNDNGIAQDHAYSLMRGFDTYYHTYRIHNHHMLVWAALFAGNFEVALACAESALKVTPDSLLIECIDFLEPYLSDVWHVFIRFGKWDRILEQTLPRDKSRFVVWYAWGCYAKALAFSALGRIEEAEDMKSQFQGAVHKVPPSRYLHNVTSLQMFEIAEQILSGELAYRRRNFQGAFKFLRNAVALHDDLPYDEPDGWMIPARHTLAALLLECSQLDSSAGERNAYVQEAKAKYEEDLKHYPRNIWSLVGLKQCESLLGSDGAFRMEEDLRLAQLGCDVDISYSCLCAGLLSDEKPQSPKKTQGDCCPKRDRRKLKSSLLPIPPRSGKVPTKPATASGQETGANGNPSNLSECIPMAMPTPPSPEPENKGGKRRLQSALDYF
jgi:ABC-type phosphate/phosphonate transport system substrate-binding protein